MENKQKLKLNLNVVKITSLEPKDAPCTTPDYQTGRCNTRVTNTCTEYSIPSCGAIGVVADY